MVGEAEGAWLSAALSVLLIQFKSTSWLDMLGSYLPHLVGEKVDGRKEL